ncbi:enoyl-CoA hydratase/isomerase family protein [Bradyrhizobium brasilense]|uniref:Enoyl-CoA hydratase/isomerase family protein n=1 Tax=Bradyrhizobium brasilense TaxID=1419277 RepID=A0ABY8JAG4_9BRAD|nr:enoyl-CoA hydratase/isomerase family protein [Bradyrhizobium brasilense]WFU62555.1 enoyl-CoA hydratase/isomerase family protein [Bradyrhizobium brasilense]
MGILQTETRGRVLVARFNHPNPHNPMSLALENAIRSICQEVENDSAIGALVLTGGKDRSFCAGGDLKELAERSGYGWADASMERVIDLYSAILKVTKPSVAAISGYAIGTGLGIALCCDWRVGSAGTQLLMWELKHGNTCVIGAYMMETFVGRAAMSDIIYGCEAIPLSWALDQRLLHEIVDSRQCEEKAIAHAQTLSEFPEVSFRQTKEKVNQSVLAGLQRITRDAKDAYAAGIASLHPVSKQ